jgi:multiple sugar transport system permease protein
MAQAPRARAATMTDTLADKAARLAANPNKVLSAPAADHSEGMSYLNNLPRRLITLYLPLSLILFVLLFPFYWMALTAIKPDEQLLDLDKFSPFWTWNPTFKHIYKLLFETEYPIWLWNTMLVAVCATAISIIASVLAAYAIVRLRYKGAQWVGGAIFLAYLVPPSILFIPLSTVVFQYGLFDTPMALIFTYPTILIPFSTWLLMGYFKTIPFELEECALIDGASRWQILTKIVLPLAIPGLISAFIFCFTLCWNEFIYALTFISSTQYKTVPVAIVTALVDGDIYRWGSLMAGALIGSLPLVILYAFFVEHYVSAMTGAVKE